jgi:hypothetical protein
MTTKIKSAEHLEEIERILDSIPQAWSQQGIGIGFDTQNPFNQSIFKKILLFRIISQESLEIPAVFPAK